MDGERVLAGRTGPDGLAALCTGKEGSQCSTSVWAVRVRKVKCDAVWSAT